MHKTPSPDAQAVHELSVGVRCTTCNWSWQPDGVPRVADIERAKMLANQHRRANPGHLTTASASERRSWAKGAKLRIVALEITNT